MTELILNNIYLVLFLPLWIFLTVMFGRFFSVYVNKFLIYILTLLSSLLGAVFCGALLYKMPADAIFEYQIPFVKINDFIIPCGIHIERASLIFALVLFLVSFCVQLFSTHYMKTEKKQYRFFALLNLFNFSMAGLFFSPNLFQTYVFWEIAGVISYLLIGFDYFAREKSLASKKVFIMNRVGDTALLGGIIICSYLMYEYSPSKSLASLSFFDMNIISSFISAYTSSTVFLIICLLFIIAAAVKSAQIPFYTWLQDAMEAKLPVSSLLHSATLVSLGVFLLIRLTPFFTLSNYSLKFIILLGLVTAVICSLSASSQNTAKQTLAYSTSAQIGLMFLGIGLLNIKAAVALFGAHAFIKSMLFLTLPKEKDENWSIFGFVVFMLGGISLAGLIFAGLISKELLVTGLSDKYIIAISLISFLTAFYISRTGFQTADKYGLNKTMPNIIEILSIFGLFGFNILLYAYLRLHFDYKITEPFWCALIGFAFVYILYKKSKFFQIPYLYELCLNGFYLDKFYTSVLAKIYYNFSKAMEFIDLRFFSNYSLLIKSAGLGVKTVKFIENKVMNGTVNTVKKLFKKLSKLDSVLQSGNIQRYNLYAFVIITAVISALVFVYTAIIRYIGG